jgi:hypothetical protein
VDENYKAVRTTAQLQLSRRLGAGNALTSEEIWLAVRRAIDLFGCADVDLDAIVADLEAAFQTIIGRERVLLGDPNGWEPWLDKRKASINWQFWNRYQQFLLQEEGWAPATLDRLDETTDRILDLLAAPDREGSWDRRGMVVGHVQSGKTGNYVGLICKAADAGYKLIVVLAGFHKSLRSQTQIRLEEGLLGYDRSAVPFLPIGVGLIDPAPRANSITTRADDGDFKRQVANNFAIKPGGDPLLFVVKKNGSVLKNLLDWVQFAATARDEHGRVYVAGVPLLVIDDEADQGSIDTRTGAFDQDGNPDPDHDPTVLNRRIRSLLALFDQSAYVGYTATPFANIFIHEKATTDKEGLDLFPGSFILALPTPSNYVGPAVVFGYSKDDGEEVPGLPMVRTVDDHAETLEPDERVGWMPPRHDKNHLPKFNGIDEIPPSLRGAIHAFLLVCATRLARRHETEHNSMLIHVTRFTNIQNRVTEQVRSEIADIRRRLRFGDGDSPHQIRRELRNLWETDFEPTTAEVAARRLLSHDFIRSWTEIEPYLEPAAVSINIREINGQAGEVLDYVNHRSAGLNVIAIGGDKLSRGLTLEGLSVSYFLRASRMYDTLMQMGRWFGYRPGYLDLCRLYTTAELTEWFAHIAAAAEELRDDFSRMVASGGTPREFGHRVKSHPSMMVTSQVKMRHGKAINVTFQGDISETINFWRVRSQLESNWVAATKLVETTEAEGKRAVRVRSKGRPDATYTGPWQWREVSSEAILTFLTDYQEHEASKKVKTKLLGDYVRAENVEGRLKDWTVFVASGDSPTNGSLGSARFNLIERSWHLAGRAGTKTNEKLGFMRQNHFRIRRLVSPADESVDLTGEQISHALERTVTAWRQDPGTRENPPERPAGYWLRRERPSTSGLLMLYPLDPANKVGSDDIVGTDKVEPEARDVPILGFAISFPYVDPKQASQVRYVVNNVYYSQEFGAPSGWEEEDPE